MTNSQLFTAAHKLAKNIEIESKYSVKLSIALKVMHKINKIESKIDIATTVTVWDNLEVSITSGVCSINNVKMREQGLNILSFNNATDFMTCEETESERFTRLAVERFVNTKAA